MASIEQAKEAIAEARVAARAAGFDGPRANHLLSEEDQGSISYAFVLEGLDDAPMAGDVEESLRELPRVHASVVYGTRMAWVTAPDGMPLATLTAVFERYGLVAVMTDSSLRRRTAHTAADLSDTGSGETSYRRRRGATQRRRRSQRQAGLDARAMERARREGFLERTDAYDDRRERDDDAQRLSTSPSLKGFFRASRNTDVLYTARDLITTARVVVAVVASLPVFVLSYVQAFQFPGWQWLCLALSVPVVTWCAWPFHRAMAGGIRRGMSALDGATSVAVLAAWLWSVITLLSTHAGEIGWRSPHQAFSGALGTQLGDKQLFLDVACGITVLLLAGRKTSLQTRANLRLDLEQRRPDPESLVTVVARDRATGKVKESPLPLNEVNVGDDVLVEPGSLVPVDGVVIGGSSHVLPSLISTTPAGEYDASRHVKVDDHVSAGSRNLEARLKIRVLRTGHATRIAAVERWVAAVNRRQNRALLLSTQTASWLIPGALFLALCGCGGWYVATRNLSLAFGVALSVLASVAPVALALSSPLPFRLGVEAGARRGLLLRRGQVIRALADVNTVVFNRVGTLANQDMTVETVTAAHGEDTDAVLRVAGALALESDHPASHAVVHAAREARDHAKQDDGMPQWIDVESFSIDADGAFHATIDMPMRTEDGKVVHRQIPAMMWRPRNLSDLSGRLARAATTGGTPLVVNWNGKDRGVITLHDTMKPDATTAVDRLEAAGIETIMLSRDTYPVARRFANRAGISRVLAGIRPGRKPLTVRALHTRGATVAMVGDRSVADCLSVADVGVLMSGHVPFDASGRTAHGVRGRGVDVVMLRQDVSAVPDLFDLAQRTCRVADRNTLFSWLYNGCAVVASLAGLLHPMVATLLMLAASLVVELGSNSVSKAIS